MPINLTRAWTASSLTPTLQPAAVAGPTATTPTGDNSIFNNIMSQVFGPNYQSLLSTGDRSGMSGGMTDPAGIEAQAYAQMAAARRNLMEQSIMQTGASNWLARTTANTPVANTAGALGQAINPDWQSAQRYQQVLTASADRSAKVAQAAALSPMFAPGMQQSVGQQNTGATFNPYGARSGWVSPVQNNNAFQAGIQSPSYNLMRMGV